MANEKPLVGSVARVFAPAVADCWSARPAVDPAQVGLAPPYADNLLTALDVGCPAGS